MNGITALEARIEDAEDHEVDLTDRIEEPEARVAKLEEAVMCLLEDEDGVSRERTKKEGRREPRPFAFH
jgi:hypothetical protein